MYVGVMYICMCVCMYADMRECVCVCTYVCGYENMYVLDRFHYRH